MILRFWALCVILLLATCAVGQKLRTLRGTVVDANTLPIPGAAVEFQANLSTQVTATDAQGEFFLTGIPATGTLVVRHLGFAPVTIAISADSPKDPLQVRMTPAPALERIQVSASDETQIPPTPTSQVFISAQTISESGSLALDDVLREAPGFTLFRRSGSLFANPTTQGVSLRGVGASGASRAAVLLDGIPLNDPFGGWVYWNQVPRESMDDVEITNGGASDMYGGGALGGVINIRNAPGARILSPPRKFPTGTKTLRRFHSTRARSSAIGESPRQFNLFAPPATLLVPADQRGSVDAPAGTADLDGSLQALAENSAKQSNFFVRFNSLRESRDNGTPVQTNNTRLPSLASGLELDAIESRLIFHPRLCLR